MNRPAIGRVVWGYSNVTTGTSDTRSAFCARVIYVRADSTVDLDVTRHDGVREIWTSVPFVAAKQIDVHGSGTRFATWPMWSGIPSSAVPVVDQNQKMTVPWYTHLSQL